MNEFFSPLGKKEDISFPEFCTLFKSNVGAKGIFVENSSKKDKDKDMKETTMNFPIHVNPKY